MTEETSKEQWIKAVDKNPMLLQDAPDELKRDQDIVLKAVSKDNRALQFVDESLFHNTHFVENLLACINRNNTSLLYYVSSLQAIHLAVSEDVKIRLRNNNDLLNFLLEQYDCRRDNPVRLWDILALFDDSFRSNRPFMSRIIKFHYSCYKLADESLLKDVDFIKEAYEQHLLQNKQKYGFVRLENLKRRDESLDEDVLQALRQDRKFMLLYFSEVLSEHMTSSQKRHFGIEVQVTFEYAASVLEPWVNDCDFMLELFSKNRMTIKYVGDSLRKNKQFWEQALKIDPDYIYASTKDLIDDSFVNDFFSILFESTNISPYRFNDLLMRTTNQEILFGALKFSADYFCRFDESKRNDRAFIIKAMKENHKVHYYLDNSFKKDKEIKKLFYSYSDYQDSIYDLYRNSSQLALAEILFSDYASKTRYFKGHFNRHHCGAVQAILKSKQYKNIDEFIEKLVDLQSSEQFNPKGSFARRLAFVKTQRDIEKYRERYCKQQSMY